MAEEEQQGPEQTLILSPPGPRKGSEAESSSCSTVSRHFLIPLQWDVRKTQGTKAVPTTISRCMLSIHTNLELQPENYKKKQPLQLPDPYPLNVQFSLGFQETCIGLETYSSVSRGERKQRPCHLLP